LSENQQLSLEPFVVTAKLTEKIVTGRLIWRDGSPVTKLRPNAPLNEKPVLYLLDPNNIRRGALNPFRPDGTESIQIDEHGKFSFFGYEGQTYVVHAHAFNALNQAMHAKHIKVNLTNCITPIELVLSLPGEGTGDDDINQELREQP
jgi:hypothetical protein